MSGLFSPLERNRSKRPKILFIGSFIVDLVKCEMLNNRLPTVRIYGENRP